MTVLAPPVRTQPRGRQLFARFERVLNILAHVAGWFPRGMLRSAWSLCDVLHGRVGAAARYCLARALARSCGRCVHIGPNVTVLGWEHLALGDHVSIHRGCYVDAQGGIAIGSHVSIAHHSTLMSADHTWEDPTLPIRENPIRTAPIEIRDDVWIGAGCRILAGVTIDSRSVAAAGAVVVRDVPPGAVVGGVPARVLKLIGEA